MGSVFERGYFNIITIYSITVTHVSKQMYILWSSITKVPANVHMYQLSSLQLLSPKSDACAHVCGRPFLASPVCMEARLAEVAAWAAIIKRLARTARRSSGAHRPKF